MMAYSDDETERLLKKLEKKITKEFTVANAETKEMAEKYFAKYNNVRYQQEYEAYQAGKYTKEQFEAWQVAQIGRGKHWEELRDSMAERLTQASSTAASYINGTMPQVFVTNANFELYNAEENHDVGISFEIYNEDVVKRLVKENPSVLPTYPAEKMVDIPKSERWNQQKLQSALLQGILQGKSIEHLADSFQSVTNMDRKSAIRNARTAVTGAQNGGRQAAFNRMGEKGVPIEKEWLATADSRTRMSHRDMDGERVKYNSDFPNGLEYPGDPAGDPSEVYNCRCTMIAIFKDNSSRDVERRVRGADGKNQVVRNMTYNGKYGTRSYADWMGIKRKTGNVTGVTTLNAAEKQNEIRKITAKELENKTKKLASQMSEADYKQYLQLVEKNQDIAKLYYDNADEIKTLEMTPSDGYYQHKTETIVISYRAQKYVNNGMSKYSTIAHEHGHFFDTKIKEGLTHNELSTINKHCNLYGGSVVVFGDSKQVASMSDQFLKAIRADREKLRLSIDDVTREIKSGNDSTAGVQDFLDGALGIRIKWGHGDKYYDRFYNNGIKRLDMQEDLKAAYKELGLNAKAVKKECRIYEASSEAWANISSAVTTGSEELDMIKKYMPNSYAEYMKIIGGEYGKKD